GVVSVATTSSDNPAKTTYTFQTTFTAPGPHLFVAHFRGDVNYQTSDSNSIPFQTTSPTTPALLLADTTPSPSVFATPVVLQATLTPPNTARPLTGTVTFFDGPKLVAVDVSTGAVTGAVSGVTAVRSDGANGAVIIMVTDSNPPLGAHT